MKITSNFLVRRRDWISSPKKMTRTLAKNSCLQQQQNRRLSEISGLSLGSKLSGHIWKPWSGGETWALFDQIACENIRKMFNTGKYTKFHFVYFYYSFLFHSQVCTSSIIFFFCLRLCKTLKVSRSSPNCSIFLIFMSY